jgi:hypothetical protein
MSRPFAAALHALDFHLPVRVRSRGTGTCSRSNRDHPCHGSADDARGRALTDMTVTIRNGRIASITPSSGARVPGKVRSIDGRGKWLMPGFSDMHMHLENDRMGRLHVGDPTLPDGTFTLEDALTPYLANGVLQVFSLASMSETIGQRVEVESGRVLGPHIATAAMLDGSPPMWPLGMTRAAATPEGWAAGGARREGGGLRVHQGVQQADPGDLHRYRR